MAKAIEYYKNFADYYSNDGIKVNLDNISDNSLELRQKIALFVANTMKDNNTYSKTKETSEFLVEQFLNEYEEDNSIQAKNSYYENQEILKLFNYFRNLYQNLFDSIDSMNKIVDKIKNRVNEINKDSTIQELKNILVDIKVYKNDYYNYFKNFKSILSNHEKYTKLKIEGYPTIKNLSLDELDIKTICDNLLNINTKDNQSTLIINELLENIKSLYSNKSEIDQLVGASKAKIISNELKEKHQNKLEKEVKEYYETSYQEIISRAKKSINRINNPSLELTRKDFDIDYEEENDIINKIYNYYQEKLNQEIPLNTRKIYEKVYSFNNIYQEYQSLDINDSKYDLLYNELINKINEIKEISINTNVLTNYDNNFIFNIDFNNKYIPPYRVKVISKKDREKEITEGEIMEDKINKLNEYRNLIEETNKLIANLNELNQNIYSRLSMITSNLSFNKILENNTEITNLIKDNIIANTLSDKIKDNMETISNQDDDYIKFYNESISSPILNKIETPSNMEDFTAGISLIEQKLQEEVKKTYALAYEDGVPNTSIINVGSMLSEVRHVASDLFNRTLSESKAYGEIIDINKYLDMNREIRKNGIKEVEVTILEPNLNLKEEEQKYGLSILKNIPSTVVNHLKNKVKIIRSEQVKERLTSLKNKITNISNQEEKPMKRAA